MFVDAFVWVRASDGVYVRLCACICVCIRVRVRIHVSASRCVCVLAYSRSSPAGMLNGESGDPTGCWHYTQLYEMQTIKFPQTGCDTVPVRDTLQQFVLIYSCCFYFHVFILAGSSIVGCFACPSGSFWSGAGRRWSKVK